MEFDAKLQFPGLEVSDRNQLLEFLGGKAIEAGIANPDYIQGLKEREAEYPTGLPISGGVAIPHTAATYVTGNTIMVATLKNPVTFHEMGGDEDSTVEVSTVLMLVLGNAETHVQQLSKLIKKIQNKDFMASLQAAETSEALAEKLTEEFAD